MTFKVYDPMHIMQITRPINAYDVSTINVQILALDTTETLSGKIYMTTDIQRAINKLRMPMFGTMPLREIYETVLEPVTHVVEALWIEDEHLMARIRFMDKSDASHAVKNLFHDDAIEFRPFGTGLVNGDVVSDYTLIEVYASIKGM